MVRQAHIRGRQFTTIVLICAFMLLGFGHKNIQTQMTPEMAAFVATGGLLSDLCGGDNLPEHGRALDCEACRIVDNLVFLRGCERAVSVDVERVQTWHFVAKRLSESQGLDSARLTRAPPYV